MELLRIEIDDGPVPGRMRIGGHVRYPSGGDEWLWFEVPITVADDVSAMANPWLVALAPLAVALREPLTIPYPVDAVLHANVTALMRVWESWYPQWPSVPVEVAAVQDASGPRGARVGAFLSGGLDSFYTALRHAWRGSGSAVEPPALDDLLTIHGFDIPLDGREAFARLQRRLENAAEVLGCHHVVISTNLRTTRWREADWGHLAHGCGLAAAALTLEPRYRQVLIAATGGYRDLHPWGSHPLTDPLYGTGRTDFLHDGAEATRVAKLRYLMTCEWALSELRVCWRSASDANCGQCSKCVRTMAAMEILGVLDRPTSFPDRRLDVDAVGRLYCEHPWDYRELRDLSALAAEHGRADIAGAANRSLRRSPGLARRLAVVRRGRGWPLIRGWADAIERRMQRRWVL